MLNSCLVKPVQVLTLNIGNFGLVFLLLFCLDPLTNRKIVFDTFSSTTHIIRKLDMTEKLDIGESSSPFLVGNKSNANANANANANDNDEKEDNTKKKKKSLIQVVDGSSDSDLDEPPAIVDENLTEIIKPPPPPEEEEEEEVADEGPSLMEIMMQEAEAAKKKKDEAEAKKKAKEAKKGLGGLKGGFFNNKSGSKKKKKQKPKAAAAADDDVYELDANGDMVKAKKIEPIPTISKKQGSDGRDSKVFQEVQDAMKRNPLEKLQEGEWANETLMQTIAKNPRLAMGLQNPTFSAAIQELQADPKKAMEKYRNNKAIFDFLNEFCGVMGDHFAKLGEEQEKKKKTEEGNNKAAAASANDDLIGPLAAAALEKDEERRKKGEVGWDNSMSENEKNKVDEIVQNQEISSILMDPAFQRVIQECGVPGRMQQYMRDPEIGPKLRKLIDSGLLKVER